ncbi:hypothetical protein RhiirA4_484970 [Rhizophagus irregularis]|uniref:Uncharacterized protein n=1 Tax=Rhizophagus irregularis TaxID=588596 RepID=A0A2I1HPJ6_9GLOM|nr:hypothetical protein RhiirA4_484970 [Rhizophagus irregularis]
MKYYLINKLTFDITQISNKNKHVEFNIEKRTKQHSENENGEIVNSKHFNLYNIINGTKYNKTI